MDTLQLQREKFKSWFDTTINQQFQLRQELVEQTLEGIFYTSKVDGWDIELEDSGAIHLPLGYLTLVTTTGNLYRIDTNYQSWCCSKQIRLKRVQHGWLFNTQAYC